MSSVKELIPPAETFENAWASLGTQGHMTQKQIAFMAWHVGRAAGFEAVMRFEKALSTLANDAEAQRGEHQALDVLRKELAAMRVILAANPTEAAREKAFEGLLHVLQETVAEKKALDVVRDELTTAMIHATRLDAPELLPEFKTEMKRFLVKLQGIMDKES